VGGVTYGFVRPVVAGPVAVSDGDELGHAGGTREMTVPFGSLARERRALGPRSGLDGGRPRCFKPAPDPSKTLRRSRLRRPERLE